jgi:hypothetical protein
MDGMDEDGVPDSPEEKKTFVEWRFEITKLFQRMGSSG